LRFHSHAFVFLPSLAKLLMFYSSHRRHQEEEGESSAAPRNGCTLIGYRSRNGLWFLFF
jgi:hypothetical protein